MKEYFLFDVMLELDILLPQDLNEKILDNNTNQENDNPIGLKSRWLIVNKLKVT